MNNLNHLSATAAARKLATREITAESLLADCIERITEREPVVQAWTVLDVDAAMRRARELDSRPASGLLHGLPIAVKDLFDTFDMPTGYGSPIYAGHRPASDAVSVALAREAGAIVVGKTVTTEFATFHPGPTCNPHNALHTPGGSSSGSAAAVADWMVPLAFGSQTAGSIVRPAAYCGVVGYKPTFGTVSRVGVKTISDTLDTIGGFARSVSDVALFVAALTGRRELAIDERTTDAPRIGLTTTHEWDHAEPETVALFEDARTRLSRLRRKRSRHHAAAAVRRSRPRANGDHGARGGAVALARAARAPRSAECRDDRDDRSGARGIARGIRRRALIGAKVPGDAAGGLRRCRRARGPEHHRRGAARNGGNRRPAVQPHLDAVARALRACAARAGTARIADRRNRRRAISTATARRCSRPPGSMNISAAG